MALLLALALPVVLSAGQAEEARLKKAPVEKCKHSNGEAAFKNDSCRYA